jgi:hypothetical protein
MARLNEFIARAANKEDKVKERFWESRFKCQALLDEAAIATCMVYVDLNPIRAGLAGIPEENDYTSIQERIHAWQKETAGSAPTEAAAQDRQSASIDKGAPTSKNCNEITDPALNGIPIMEHFLSDCVPLNQNPDAAAF